ncbi:MAG TPA: hypothetical protein VHP32_12520 [Ignavibacteria bacterium]|nr:hypothetical protein [Ignavibacteria bacterium]
MKFLSLLFFILFLSKVSFAQVGKVEIDSANNDKLTSMVQSIELQVTKGDILGISFDFDRYSSRTQTLYALILKVSTGSVLSFVERDSCIFTINKNISFALKSVYVDAFFKDTTYNNWIHFDYPQNILSLLQKISSLEIKLYNLGQIYEAKMREEDVQRFNEYMKEYITLK